MPAARLTKASISNAIAALKEHGLTPSSMRLNPDGSFSIDCAAEAMPTSAPTQGPKKWGHWAQ